MKKKRSLIERVKEAERRERDAERRMRQLQARLEKTERLAKGGTVWVAALAARIGPIVHVPKEEIEAARMAGYKARVVEDGSVDLIKDGYLGSFEK